MEREIRCGRCNKLLAKGEALDLAIKCPRCGAINHVRGMIPNIEGRRASQERPLGHNSPETISSANHK